MHLTHRLTALAVTLACVLALYGAFLPLHQDLAGSLLSGALSVELGAEFGNYSIYFPPVEKFWFSLAVMIGDVLGVQSGTVLLVQTVLAVIISVELAFRVRAQTTGADIRFYLGSLAALIVLPILFKNVFGLREHMVLLGLWPYLVLRYSGQEATISRGLRVAIGLWLGFTLLFKYLYCVVVALVEFADAIASRRFLHLFRLEALLAAAVVFLYLLFWLGIDATQREAIAAMRVSISANLKNSVQSAGVAGFRFAIALIFFVFLIYRGLGFRINFISLAVFLGTLTIAWVQFRWYPHHLFPIALSFIIWWWIAAPKTPLWAHIVLLTAFGVQFSGQVGKISTQTIRTNQLEIALANSDISLTGKRVALMTQHPSPYNEVIAQQGGLRWTPMMNIAYFAAKLAPLNTPENDGIVPPPVTFTEPGRALLHDTMMQLWVDYPPDVIILDRTHRWPLQYVDMDWQSILAQDPQFTDVISGFEPALSHRHDHLAFDLFLPINAD